MITLEAFAKDKRSAVPQALEVKHLVQREKQWLKITQPDTYSRYETKDKAAHTITRIARHTDEIKAHIIRRDKVAIGLATIIFNQQIVHPEAGMFQGSDLDYWLRHGEDIFTHRQVVQQLLAANEGQAALATVLQTHANPALGFDAAMQRVGEPASLSTGERADPFGIARSGAPAQLYVLPSNAELPPTS